MLRGKPTIVALLTLSCSSSVELAGPILTASSDPTVLGNVTEMVEAVAVDDQRLYWIGTDGDAEYDRKVSLHSCVKDHCVDSLLTYTASRVNEASGFGLENGQIYWFQAKDNGRWQLVACDVAGCGDQPRSVGFDTQFVPGFSAFTPEALYFCSTSDGLWRVPLLGDSAASVLYASPKYFCNSLTAHGGYVYWIASDNGPFGLAAIQRMRTDGSGQLETFVDNLEISSAQQPSSSSGYPSNGIAVDDSYVYWSQNTQRGSIARCPVSDCANAPEMFAGPIRSPTTLLLNSSALYWQHSTNTRGLAVSGCSLEQCVLNEPIAQGIDAANALAVDDQYFYTATTAETLSPEQIWTNPIAQIRRIPK